MRIISWNVNSIRARLQHVLMLLKREQPDVLFLQETKVRDEQFPYEAFECYNYNIEIRGQKTYCGVAIFSKTPLEDVNIDFSEEARYIQAFTNKTNLINVYVPQGQELGCEKYFYKLNFLEQLIEKIKPYSTENTILAGDFNIAMYPHDSYKPEFAGNICSAAERHLMQKILEHGYLDIVHDLGFTWWGYMAGALHKNLGFRIDNIFASQSLASKLEKYDVLKEYRKLERASDHAPIMAQFAQ